MKQGYRVVAASGKPSSLDPEAAARWFWRETEAGALLRAAAERATASPQPLLKTLGARTLVPRAYL